MTGSMTVQMSRSFTKLILVGMTQEGDILIWLLMANQVNGYHYDEHCVLLVEILIMGKKKGEYEEEGGKYGKEGSLKGLSACMYVRRYNLMKSNRSNEAKSALQYMKMCSPYIL